MWKKICTLKQCIQHRLAGESPMKQGGKGNIAKLIYNTFCDAFEFHVKINQFNGKSVDNI